MKKADKMMFLAFVFSTIVFVFYGLSGYTIESAECTYIVLTLLYYQWFTDRRKDKDETNRIRETVQ